MTDISPTDPAIVSPLGPFKGERPPAPGWFHSAIARAPERTFIPVDGVAIETLIWGDADKPGLIFLHGNGAHADWYSFIAPFFADDYRVIAISWSGMGGSGWRERYSLDSFGDEVLAVAAAVGLLNGPEKPIIVAHSFGGAIGLRLAASRGDQLKGAVILDNVPRPPHLRWTGPPNRADKKPPTYPSLTAALARFRLMPPQGCENLYLVDHIGRGSIVEDVAEDGITPIFRWRFDPGLWPKMDRTGSLESEHDLSAAKCPLAMIWGAQSQLVPQEGLDFTRQFIPAGTPMIALPDAQHHLMLDQPLATVAALRALLSAWPAR